MHIASDAAAHHPVLTMISTYQKTVWTMSVEYKLKTNALVLCSMCTSGERPDILGSTHAIASPT